MCIYIIIYNHENNVPSGLSPQRFWGTLCTWTHDAQLHIPSNNEPKNAQETNKWSLVIHDTQSAQMSRKQDVYRYIYM